MRKIIFGYCKENVVFPPVITVLFGTMMFLVLFCLLVSVTCSCPVGWTQHGDSCYHFSHDKESWGDAFTFCKILGGYLVEIGTEAEATFIENQVNMFNERYWIGASDVLVEGEYLWMTSMTNISYSNWAPSQPDNSGTNENCVEVWTSKQWNDGPCSNPVRYICESELRTDPIIIGY